MRLTFPMKAATTFALAGLLPLAALAAPAQPSSEAPTLELSVEAQGSAPNDLFAATLFAEATDSRLAPLARKLNTASTAALATIRSAPAVKLRSSATRTTPVRGRDGNRIESWRMVSEFALESRDAQALSELITKLQDSGLGLARIDTTASQQTRKKTEDQAIGEAIAAFKARAELAAQALGQHYRIRKITINTQSAERPQPVFRAALASSAGAAAPVEAGESLLTVSVSGTVELLP
ncbi:SIMPL domain-containing protein [Niveibacterium terrae]|uniref:SIMPL domain-containing protein n=1 Tax=Niveibacterium terrae TaxID=3373598 RepID=UPI003A917B47